MRSLHEPFAQHVRFMVSPDIKTSSSVEADADQFMSRAAGLDRVLSTPLLLRAVAAKYQVFGVRLSTT